MSSMPGVMIVAAGADPARLHAALSLAAASAALDRPAQIFLQGEAVALLQHQSREGDENYRRSGVPGLEEMIVESLALGVAIIACQSGMALAGMSAEDLPAGVETGGLVGFLASQTDEQLLMA